MRLCGFSVTESLKKVCDKLGKQIPNSGKFSAFTSTTGKSEVVDITISIRSLCKKLNLQVNRNDSCCCFLEGDKLQIEISIANVKISGIVRERSLESIAFNSMTFIPSPDLVSDDKFLLLELVELPEEKAQLLNERVERNTPSEGEN